MIVIITIAIKNVRIIILNFLRLLLFCNINNA